MKRKKSRSFVCALLARSLCILCCIHVDHKMFFLYIYFVSFILQNKKAREHRYVYLQSMHKPVVFCFIAQQTVQAPVATVRHNFLYTSGQRATTETKLMSWTIIHKIDYQLLCSMILKIMNFYYIAYQLHDFLYILLPRLILWREAHQFINRYLSEYIRI